MRTNIKPQARAQSRSLTLQPPVRGWIANEPLVDSKPGGALVLENWFPTKTAARVRGGSQRYANIAGDDPIYTLFTYRSGSLELFFAATETAIIEISDVPDDQTLVSPYYFLTNPDTGAYLTNPYTGAFLTGGLRPESVVGQSGGHYITAMFGNVSGDYLSAVNGEDIPKLFDGISWSSHEFTGEDSDGHDIAPADLSFVWSYGSRLWYIEKDSLKVWYLPIDQINGELTPFSLAGIFQEGGSLMMGGKWSLDAGDGLDDKWFVVTTTGEVAVYEGTDPGDAAAWSKVGVYKITPPMGPKALTYAGGDPIIGVEDGVITLSLSVDKDEAALSLAAVTKQIEPEWKREVDSRVGLWEFLKWPAMNMMIVSLPVTSPGIDDYCFVCNVETGAWTKYTGWDTQCLALFEGNGYFGSSTGKVLRMESGGSDDGEPYTCTFVGLPDHMKMPGVTKLIHSARTTFKTSFKANPKISASVNYNIKLPVPPASGADFTLGSEWDVGLWDVATWDSAGTVKVAASWSSIGLTGFIVSPQVQVTCGYTLYPQVELVSFDFLFEPGGVFV